MMANSSQKESCLEFASRRAVVYGLRGMVASTQPLASEAGMRTLQRGGSAADACVAMAAALQVTEPCMTGLGGDAFALYFDAATKKVECIMGNGASPAGLTLAAVRAHREMAGRTTFPLRSALTVTVPGAAGCWHDASERWGKVPLATALEPAIELAEAGFPVSFVASQIWADEADSLREAASGTETPFLPNDRPPVEGEVFSNPALGATLREIAGRGAYEGFYKGRIAEAIAAAVAARGGVLTTDDLAQHQSRLVEPASVVYRGLRVYETPPPTAGLVALMALKMLEEVGDVGGDGAARVHAQAEAIRLAFADALQFCADETTDGAAPPLADLLDEARLRRRWQEHFDAARRHPAPEPDATLVSPPPPPPPFYAPQPGERRIGGEDTCYFCAVDRWGNACSFIQSNYCGFGTGIVPQASGFALQNRGHNFILREGHPNCVGPRKFSYHTIMPALVTREATGDLYAALGVMGGFMQPQGHVQVLCALVDGGLDPQRALDLPRFMVDGADSWRSTSSSHEASAGEWGRSSRPVHRGEI